MGYWHQLWETTTVKPLVGGVGAERDEKDLKKKKRNTNFSTGLWFQTVSKTDDGGRDLMTSSA